MLQLTVLTFLLKYSLTNEAAILSTSSASMISVKSLDEKSCKYNREKKQVSITVATTDRNRLLQTVSFLRKSCPLRHRDMTGPVNDRRCLVFGV